MIKQTHCKTLAGEDRYAVTAEAVITASGIAVLLTGGTLPHVGCIALAQPAKGARTLSVEGHREAEIAAPICEQICSAAGCAVAVTAGIHVDSATPDEINTLSKNAFAAGEMLIGQIKQILADTTGGEDA